MHPLTARYALETLPRFRDTHSPHDDVSAADVLLADLPDWARCPMPSLPPIDPPMAALIERRHPDIVRALREKIAAAESRAAARDGWVVAPVVYRIPTDVLDLVDAVALYQERGYEVVTKGTTGDPTLLRVIVRRVVEPSLDAYRASGCECDVGADDPTAHAVAETEAC